MYLDFVTGAVLGGMLYDSVKLSVQVSAEMVKEKAKDSLKMWLADEPTTEKIANRINVLGYNESESKEEYCHRLGKDNELTQLLTQFNQPTISQNIDTVYGIGQNSGTIINPIINIDTQGDKPKKS